MRLRRRWAAVGLGVVWGWIALGLIGNQAVAATEADDTTPLIVTDEGETKTPTATRGAASTASPESPTTSPAPNQPNPPPSAPPSRPPAGLAGEQEVVRKAIIESSTLLDPTQHSLGTLQDRLAAGGDGAENPLLPQSPTSAPSPLPEPESSAAVKAVEPIMGNAPFASEGKPDRGPVVMGAELNSNDAVTPLSPEQTPPEFLDGPIVEPTDPWVFSVETAALFDDNIRLSGRDQQEDLVFVLSASIAWQWGDVRLKRGSWARVYYEATGIAFVQQSDENNVDHDLQAGVQKRAGKLAAALEGRYRRLSGATPDLGDRVQRDDYQLKASGAYEFSGKTFVEGNAAWNSVRYQEAGLADYDEFLGELFAGYELSGRTKIAAGGAVGRLQVADVGQQNFQRALVKVTRASTGALGFTGKAGAEFRQSATGQQVTPVFSLAADYEPIEDSTKITGEVFRETVSSGALAGENYLRTGAAVRLNQRLGSRFVAGLEVGYEHLNYVEVGAGQASGRADDFLFAKPSLKYEFNARRRAEVFYSYRQNDSSLEDFSFSANQWGLAIGLDF